MDREITEIIDRLEELKSRANELGQQRESFIDSLKAAESILEVARKEVEEAKREKGTHLRKTAALHAVTSKSNRESGRLNTSIRMMAGPRQCSTAAPLADSFTLYRRSTTMTGGSPGSRRPSKAIKCRESPLCRRPSGRPVSLH